MSGNVYVAPQQTERFLVAVERLFRVIEEFLVWKMTR